MGGGPARGEQGDGGIEGLFRAARSERVGGQQGGGSGACVPDLRTQRVKAIREVRTDEHDIGSGESLGELVVARRLDREVQTAGLRERPHPAREESARRAGTANDENRVDGDRLLAFQMVPVVLSMIG